MKRWILIALLCCGTAHAESFVNRSKDIIANGTGPTVPQPTNAIQIRVITAYVYLYPSQWQQLLEKKGMAINPATPENPLAIGTLDGETFTPAANPVIRQISSLHHIRMVRAWHKEILQAYAIRFEPVAAEHVGKSAEKIAQDIAAEVAATSKTELGDPDTDTDE
jgi:hypothetical protein